MAPNTNNVSLFISAGRPDRFRHVRRPKSLSPDGLTSVKSSLINAIFGRKSLARVSSTPGKTITVNFYDVDGAFFLVDLPGYGYAKRTAEEQKRWSALVDSYFSKTLTLTF